MDDLLRWMAVGARLLRANPIKFAKAFRAVERIVEGQEALAEFDDQLILRPGRPEKRYRA